MEKALWDYANIGCFGRIRYLMIATCSISPVETSVLKSYWENLGSQELVEVLSLGVPEKETIHRTLILAQLWNTSV